MYLFFTESGWQVTGDVAGYYVSESGERMMRIRLRNSRICVEARVSRVMVRGL